MCAYNPITCSQCGAQAWCLRDNHGSWWCKNCFLEQSPDNTVELWNDLNEQAKQARAAKLNQDYYSGASGNNKNQYNNNNKPKKAPEPKPCRYGCGSILIWDYKLQGSNKFKDVNTDVQHSYQICADILKSQGKKMVK